MVAGATAELLATLWVEKVGKAVVRGVAALVVFGTGFTDFQARPAFVDAFVTPCELGAALFDAVEVLRTST